MSKCLLATATTGPADVPASPLHKDGRATEDLQAAALATAPAVTPSCQHHDVIVLLKIHLNALLPISRLPNEILAEMFLHYKAAMRLHHRRPGARAGADALAWLAITHVCHHWRGLALDTPELWTSFSVGGRDDETDFVSSMLARSKHMPLSVQASLYKDSNHTSLETVLHDLHRIDSLDLELAPQIQDQLRDAVPAVAPLLQSLTISTTERGSSMVGPMPTLFDHCEFPALRELEVTGFRLSWTSGFLAPSLTALKVTCWGRYSAPWTPMLEAISRMPMLEHIELSGSVTLASPADHYSPNPPRTPVTLAHLRYLSLTSGNISITHVFDSLLIPASCQVSLCLRACDVAGSASLAPVRDAVLSKLSGRTTIGPVKPFKTFSVWKELPTTVVVALWRAVVPAHQLNYANPHLPRPDLRLSIMLFPSTAEDVLGMCSHLPLREVEVVSVAHAHCDMPAYAWDMLFSFVPKVTAVRLYDLDDPVQDIHGMLTAAYPSSSSTLLVGSGAPIEYLAPRLRELTLDSVRFREAFDPEDDMLLSELTVALNARRAAHVAVDRVCIVDCKNMGGRDVEKLRGAALVEVLWDGVERVEEFPGFNFLHGMGGPGSVAGPLPGHPGLGARVGGGGGGGLPRAEPCSWF
ncbi:hypothetical protein EIP91_004625 [Steccherinum ochraceum]|uniref:Uncharacterized protein n=1 Tax=Steccherinum ochraceum TaxID=92696 RepID=A0A4R0RUB9_9APHY|nr:hypothetical protein EIP91_004625 [Steccherinum ochraceum]